MTTNQTFGQAIEALKQGKKVTRSGWNETDANMDAYLWLLPASKVQAIWCKNLHLKELAEASGGEIECFCSIRMKTVDNKVLTGWIPSQIDMFAEDWIIL